MKHKLLSILLSLSLVISLLPTVALADEGESSGASGLVAISSLQVDSNTKTYDKDGANSNHLAYEYYTDKFCHALDDAGSAEPTLTWVKKVTISGINFNQLTDSSEDMETLQKVIMNGRRIDISDQFKDSIEVKFVNCTFNQTNATLQVYKIMPCNVTKFTFDGCTFNQAATGQYAITLNVAETLYDSRAISYEIINSIVNSSGRGINITPSTENETLGSHMPSVVISDNTFTLPTTNSSNMAVQIAGNWDSANLSAASEPLITFSNNNITAYTAVRIHETMRSNKGNSAKYVAQFSNDTLAGGTQLVVADGDDVTTAAIAAHYTAVLSNDFAAEIGNKKYVTLPEAIAAASDGDTVALLKAVVLDSLLEIRKDLTLDLGGRELSRNRSVLDIYSNVTIQNGTIETTFADEGSTAAVWVNNTAKLTVASDVAMSTTPNAYALAFDQSCTAAEVIFKGRVTGGNGITVNGLIAGATNNKLTMDGANITVSGHGIYQAGYANTAFSNENSVISGATGIEVRAGKLTVNNSTISGSGEFKSEANPGGPTTDGAGIAIVQHTTNLPIDVTISGGSISGPMAIYQATKQSENTDESIANIKLSVTGGEFTGKISSANPEEFVSGGLFSTDPSDYLATGYFVDKTTDSSYPYTVTNVKPSETPTFVNENTSHDNSAITDTDTKNAIDAVIGNAKVEGVADAVDDSALVADYVDADEVGAAKKVDVEIEVGVAVKSADLSDESETKTLVFEVKPVATITVTKSDGTVEAKGNVEVPNGLLSGEITVKLPLPTGFTPKQIMHTSSDGSVEYFINKNDGTMRGAKTFEIKDGCAVFTITKFSTFVLSGKVTYVEPSSSSGSSGYYVSTPSKTENGTVTVSLRYADKGDTVTITVKPDSGYVLDDLTVTDKNGDELTLKDKGNGEYTFTMPSGRVEVKASFTKKIETSPFADVATDAYYYEAVKWAVSEGITTGVGDNLFAPEQPCTRAQIVTFLWRAAASPEPKGTAVGMTDVVSGSYYKKAVAWAIENGVTTGTTATTFSPDTTCTRAQAVTFLARALNAKAASAAEFSDVPTDSYFAEAVAWASARSVTEGVGNGLFAPDNACTRGQIVTFLFRAYNK